MDKQTTLQPGEVRALRDKVFCSRISDEGWAAVGMNWMMGGSQDWLLKKASMPPGEVLDGKFIKLSREGVIPGVN